MSIKKGDLLPDATLLCMTEEGPKEVSLSDHTRGQCVVLVGLPGPYTGTCTEAHVPSLLRVHDELKENGVNEVICFSVSDPFVMKAFAESTGAEEAGIVMLADSAGELTTKLGLGFDAPAVGFYGRAIRHSMMVEDGFVKVLLFEEAHGACDLTAGEALVDAISEFRAS
ncbi:MAG TPA: peroxiredoxin [Gemmatimonadetes bacterium]|nr:peroxiredoxin [Gemmatimonadota bacterium]HCO13265.1 peroxiredoxin [Gemmatimonadota bacterium]|tara:strand:- start:972 stop:1478 length:507 start_codon:yes stop_codon:yes gene_type:complete